MTNPTRDAGVVAAPTRKVVVPAGPAARRRRARQRAIRGVGGLVVFFAVWQLLSSNDVFDPLFIGSPSGIVESLYELLADGTLVPDIKASATEFVLGFGLGTLGAILLGMVIGWSRFLDDALDPLLSALYATPYVAFLPLIIVWVGIGLWSKVVIVLWACFFPVLINTIAGVKNTPPEYLRVADSFRVGSLRLFRTVILPSSVPYILAGLRQAIGRSLVGVIVAEFFLASQGVGFFISHTTSAFRANDAFAAILLVSLTGVMLVSLVGAVERSVAKRWGLTRGA
jgi:NitT/TauT family transport system permease protein